MKEVAERIKQLRESVKLSQKKICTLTGATNQASRAKAVEENYTS